MRISDWNSDVCSSDLKFVGQARRGAGAVAFAEPLAQFLGQHQLHHAREQIELHRLGKVAVVARGPIDAQFGLFGRALVDQRSEEHTSELQSLMRTSFAVFCLKKKTKLKLHITAE